jgi:hypothetical protein
MYSSGNINVRSWVHLFESPCIHQDKKVTNQFPICVFIFSIPANLTTVRWDESYCSANTEVLWSCCIRMNLLWFLLSKIQRRWILWQTGDPILSHNWGRRIAETGCRWLDATASVSKKAVVNRDTGWANIKNQWRSTNKLITDGYCMH